MKKLKELRERKKISQSELSKQIGIEYQNYNKYELNKNEPNIKTLIKLADYFNVSLDYLCDRQWNNQIGYIPDNKKEVIQLVLQLNEINTIKLFGYASGLLAGQN